MIMIKLLIRLLGRRYVIVRDDTIPRGQIIIFVHKIYIHRDTVCDIMKIGKADDNGSKF